MNKQRVFVRNVLPCAGDLDVAFVKMNGRELQICLPKYCNTSKYIGEEVYYEIRNGRYRVSEIRSPKVREEASVQDVSDVGED
ncbi:MAG: hypothetical protein NC548_40385 [Lachnospiraceae bacterium]|nr:hypothetical protein [Lachnospiraceae bacterium]